jgi:hypothetical protein
MLFIFYKDEFPKRAEGIRDFSISGIIFGFVLGVIYLLMVITENF